jgi:fructokinase
LLQGAAPGRTGSRGWPIVPTVRPEHVTAVADRIHELLSGRDRVLAAIAGPPGSGKSTLAAAVARRLVAQRVAAEVVPMDGFHLDNAVLDRRGLRRRKGAPETFDAAGFVHLVRRLRAGGEVVVPAFDRARDIAIAGAQVVPDACRAVIVEGNYLLYDAPPWSELAAFWDLTVRLSPPEAELRSRLIQRWLDHGLSRAAATRRAEDNDLPNARAIMARALPAQMIL